MHAEPIPIKNLVYDGWNPDKMDDASFSALVEEIETTGRVDPVFVEPVEDGRYRIVRGEYRWMALRVLGHTEVPCVIQSKV